MPLLGRLSKVCGAAEAGHVLPFRIFFHTILQEPGHLLKVIEVLNRTVLDVLDPTTPSGLIAEGGFLPQPDDENILVGRQRKQKQ
jgi:hypothetical protein